MDTIPESGYFNTNRYARIFLESIQEIIGEHGLNSILNYAGLSSLIDNFPPDNLDRAFDFANFSLINQALTEIYGERGGRGISLRIGKITFDDVLKDYGSMAGVGELDFKVLPAGKKIEFGLKAMARIFSENSDKIASLIDEGDHFIYRVERCPFCWGLENQDQPVCYYMVGLLQEGLLWVSGGKEFQVVERSCLATGDQACEFEIHKEHFD